MCRATGEKDQVGIGVSNELRKFTHVRENVLVPGVLLGVACQRAAVCGIAIRPGVQDRVDELIRLELPDVVGPLCAALSSAEAKVKRDSRNLQEAAAEVNLLGR